MLSRNLHRRHLDETQRAMVGAKAKELFKKQAKQRQKRAAVIAKVLQQRINRFRTIVRNLSATPVTKLASPVSPQAFAADVQQFRHVH
jgi:DNA-binding protein H-NS